MGREAIRGIHEHAEAGELARTLAIVFIDALAAYVLVPWFLDRRNGSTPAGLDAGAAAAAPKTQPTWLRPVLMAFVALAAVASMVSIIDAGHSGASKAWEDLAETSTGD